jgi:hypothetical protein
LQHGAGAILDALQPGTRRQQDFEDGLGLMHKNVRAAHRQKHAIEVADYSGRYAVISAYLEADCNEFSPISTRPLRKLEKGKSGIFLKDARVNQTIKPRRHEV